MSARDGIVECCDHGEQHATYVCQHIIQALIDGKHRGFWTSDDPENPGPDAWCGTREEKIQETNGEWDDESEAFAGISLLCGAFQILNGQHLCDSPGWLVLPGRDGH